MCTVTYIPPGQKNNFILTSNRDEKDFRPTIPPEVYEINDMKLSFPKDLQAGGSWIAMNETGRLCCLLNGAFQRHEKENHHILSRGKILIEITSFNGLIPDYMISKDLNNVEPFTIITIEQDSGSINYFSEFIWDGHTKYYKELDSKVPYIWSSVTLYSEEHRKLRHQWFANFFKENADLITTDKVFSFHSGEHSSDNNINIVMKREGGLKTVSITQVTPSGNKLKMNYHILNDCSTYILHI